MHKYLVTQRSSNQITGPILVTTSPRYTCPASCGLKGSLCYAEHGFLGGYIWSSLDRTAVGDTVRNGMVIQSLAQLVLSVQSLPHGAVWRHNQAGDLMPESDNRDRICLRTLTLLCDANHGRRGFTFTHFDARIEHNRAAIAHANMHGFRVNLSADNLYHADELADVACAPVAAILPRGHRTKVRTPRGRTVVVCPARTHGVTCSTCKLCTRERDVIVGLPLL